MLCPKLPCGQKIQTRTKTRLANNKMFAGLYARETFGQLIVLEKDMARFRQTVDPGKVNVVKGQ